MGAFYYSLGHECHEIFYFMTPPKLGMGVLTYTQCWGDFYYSHWHQSWVRRWSSIYSTVPNALGHLLLLLIPMPGGYILLLPLTPMVGRGILSYTVFPLIPMLEGDILLLRGTFITPTDPSAGMGFIPSTDTNARAPFGPQKWSFFTPTNFWCWDIGFNVKPQKLHESRTCRIYIQLVYNFVKHKQSHSMLFDPCSGPSHLQRSPSWANWPDKASFLQEKLALTLNIA